MGADDNNIWSHFEQNGKSKKKNDDALLKGGGRALLDVQAAEGEGKAKRPCR